MTMPKAKRDLSAREHAEGILYQHGVGHRAICHIGRDAIVYTTLGGMVYTAWLELDKEENLMVFTEPGMPAERTHMAMARGKVH